MDPLEHRNTLGHFATGVTVITTTKGEELVGLTANAFTSLSLDPPLILVCIDKKSSSIGAFSAGHPFAVNILQEEQNEVCSNFAKKGGDKFRGVSFSISNDGVPILNDNLATIECKVHKVIEGGDHYIVTGYVKNACYNDKSNPLLFYRGKLGPISEHMTVTK